MQSPPKFENRQLIYVSTKYGLEYVGEYEFYAHQDFPLVLNRARRIHLTSFPVPTQEGVRIVRNLELGFVSMCEHSIQSIPFEKDDIQFFGVPDKQISDIYMKSVYGLEAVPANGSSRIVTN